MKNTNLHHSKKSRFTKIAIYGKSALLLMILFMASSPTKAHAQIEGEIGKYVGSYLLKKVISNLSVKKTKYFLGGRKKTRWCAKYSDGTEVCNNFRNYRTFGEVFRYYYEGNGDCNASKTYGGATVCYRNSWEARRNIDRFGGQLIDIYIKRPPARSIPRNSPALICNSQWC